MTGKEYGNILHYISHKCPGRGWEIYGTFNSRKEAEKAIDDIEEFKGTDIEADTLNKNSRVVSKTSAMRDYHIDPEFDYYCL